MTSWRTRLAIVVLASSCGAASAQSLGDVARLERQRRSRMAHHAPVLTDEDLRRDHILKKTPLESDSALPSLDNSTNIDENLPLGDYVRALRQRLVAEPTPAAGAVATGPAPEPPPTAAAPLAPEQQPARAASGQKTPSLGDLAREVRAERQAARRARMQKNRPQPAAQASNNAAPTDKARPVPQTARKMPSTAASPKLARSKEVHTKASTLQPRATLEPGAMGQQSIRVPRGSSLWKLARVYLGAGSLWTALWKANPQIHDPNRIRAGQLVRFPVPNDQDNPPTRSAGVKLPGRPGNSPTSARAQVRKSLFSRPLSR